MTRILLISAVRRPNEFSYRPRPALGLGYIASYLRKYNNVNEIKIIERSYEYDIKELIEKYKPHIVGISSTTQEHNAAISAAKNIKIVDKEIPIIMGGHHITALPNTLTEYMDIGVLGEGEETFSEIVRFYEEGNLYSRLDEISGIVHWKYGDGDRNGNVVTTKRRDLIKPIDNIPFPARDLLNTDVITHIITSRGCPYNCIYCSAASFWRSYRFHSPEYTVNEMKELVYKYGAKIIDIEDDLFIAQKKRVEEISKLICEEGLNEKVTFRCLCRANLINEDIMKQLKSMNVQAISIGIETGSENILHRIKGGTVIIQQNKDALNLSKKYGIKTHGFFMIGAPNETKEEMLETKQFIKENPLDTGIISVMVPYPGTEIWNYAKDKGVVNEDMNWDLFDMDFIENNEKYLVIDDVLSRKDLNKMYLKIRNELDNKLPFHKRNFKRLIRIYHSYGGVRILPHIAKFKSIIGQEMKNK